jgi:dihydroflavonol-4-reductase
MGGKRTVLVTGGSGFIGSWCVIGMLQQGYTVRTIGKVVYPQNRLSFHAAELTSDAGWDAAASGCDYVLHVASPVAVSEPKNADELMFLPAMALDALWALGSRQA